MGVGEGAVEGLEVGDDVLDEEGADGDDAGEGVEFVPEVGVAFAGAEWLHAFELGLAGRGGRRCWRGGGGHGDSLES
ncbi:hypothetical protein RBB78_20340 [Tunturiibacter empetritectus]|uniref:hypothetical protein n=1 Tax=Tunturiibacter empetritectus TaxID=3069691 RepID=UPI003D9B1E66